MIVKTANGIFDQIKRHGLSTVLLVGLAAWVDARVADPLISSTREFLHEQVRIAAEQATVLKKLEDVSADHRSEMEVVRLAHQRQIELLEAMTKMMNDRKG